MNSVYVRLAAVLTSLASGGCNGNGEGAFQDLGDLSGEVVESPAAPLCVWNQAYQENTEPDSVERILARASSCYVLLDPFDSPAAREAIPAIQEASNTVGCYISVGTCESWREDYEALAPSCSDQEWPEWPGEYFISDPDGALPHMIARVETLAGWGCDMVEFDNMDFAGEAERFDLDVTEESAAAYTLALCEAVHEAGMGCMAKNARVTDNDGFDGGTFESFHDELDWWSHDHLQSFVDQGKPAVIFHYNDARCEDVTRFYGLRYGSGVSVLCEDPEVGGYLH